MAIHVFPTWLSPKSVMTGPLISLFLKERLYLDFLNIMAKSVNRSAKGKGEKLRLDDVARAKMRGF
jgi:hypothetical protein